MNTYISPWHIFFQLEGAPTIVNESITPEIYYS